MNLVMRPCQRLLIQTLDLVIPAHAGNEAAMAYGLQLPYAGSVQSLIAQRFAIAAALGNPQSAVAIELPLGHKPMRSLNEHIE